MTNIVAGVRQTLRESVDEKTKQNFSRFFKGEVQCYGVKSSEVGKIAKRFWKEIKDLPKEDIFQLCEELFSSGISEDAFVVSFWLEGMSARFEKDDMQTFERWIKLYIDNWAKCDGFCNHAVGDLVMMHPELVADLKRWARTDHPWLKRAAAVSLILPARKGHFLEDVFEIADILLTDEHDLVQKGYGWMLKEASRLHQQEVFDYVVDHRRQMPRTALRYAIELMPPEMRKEAMKKDW